MQTTLAKALAHDVEESSPCELKELADATFKEDVNKIVSQMMAQQKTVRNQIEQMKYMIDKNQVQSQTQLDDRASTP